MDIRRYFKPVISDASNSDKKSDRDKKDAETKDFLNALLKTAEENVYDFQAWNNVLSQIQDLEIQEARPYYEKILTRVGNHARYWKIFIEHEMKSRNYDRVDQLFTRCLVKVLNIDLWMTYLSFVKETKCLLPLYRMKMSEAYNLALNKMGMDIMSFPIWNDCINFLKNVEAVGSYEESERKTAVRNVYQRGIMIPMISIEQLWKDYVSYEKIINPFVAEKMIQDRSRDYLNVLRVTKEYEAVTTGLARNAPSTPPQGLPEEIQQVELWKKYIAWEKLNPLNTEDQSVVINRVMFAYEQCLLCLGHHPDIWFEYALFLKQSSKLLIENGDLTSGNLFSEEAASIYERATTYLKTNLGLHFAYAEFEEGRRNFDKVKEIYEKLIENPDIDPTLTYIQYMHFARRYKGIENARKVIDEMRKNTACTYHGIVAAALMEYYCSKDSNISYTIFELGLRHFGNNIDYILAYIDYLSHTNNDNTRRNFFNRVLSSDSPLPIDKQMPIFEKFIKFELQVGNLESIEEVEKRRAAIIRQLPEYVSQEMELFLTKFKFLDLDPCKG